MAKRKRLTPAKPDYLSSDIEAATPENSRPSMRPAPIAQVVEESSEAAALSVVSEELRRARTEGRLIQKLPLSCLAVDYLVRDRMLADESELQSLMDSLRDRGQQAPIDVTKLDGDRYGLISGWRRVTALQKLLDETSDERFASVLAIVREPETSSDAYRAMVEENEIRVGLSFYERARIAAKAAEQGAFKSEREAVQVLFVTASRAKRSKIYSFLDIYHALDGSLSFPNMLSERQGLTLAKALADDPDLSRRLRDRLRKAKPQSAEKELAILSRVTDAPEPASVPEQEVQRSEPKSQPAQRQTETIRIEAMMTEEVPRVVLSGPGIDDAFLADLRKWIARQTGNAGNVTS